MKKKFTWVYTPNKAEPPYLLDVNLAAVNPVFGRMWVKLSKYRVYGDSVYSYPHPSHRQYVSAKDAMHLKNEQELPEWIQARIAVLRIAAQDKRIPTIGTHWDTSLFTIEIGIK